MFAVYAKEPNPTDPMASLVLGDMPEPVIDEGWLCVKITRASLNRHDVFTRADSLTKSRCPIP